MNLHIYFEILSDKPEICDEYFYEELFDLIDDEE